LHIAHIVTRLDVGGAQSHVLHLASAQRARGDLVTVITGAEGTASDTLRSRGIEVVTMPRLVRSIELFGDLRALRDLDRLLVASTPDVVHAHSSKAGILTRLVARWRRIPTVYTAHGWPFVPGVLWPQRVLSRAGEAVGGRLWGEVICVTESDALLARAKRIAPARRIHVVANGIPDVASSGSTDPEPAAASPSRPCTITMVARFFPQKDHDGLLRAASLVNVDRPWTLVLVGDGPLLPEVRALSTSLGLDDRVQFLGERDDVADILARSDVAVLWSRYEGLPLALLETCRSGLPWVAKDLPGTRAILGDSGAGILAGDVFALAQALTRLVSDDELRVQMGSEGRRRFLEAYTLDPMVTGIDAVYAQAMLRSGKPRRSTTGSGRR
jgi:glycosyltransferase involved in cell wall biosynthesis